jgi:hypothetical protein
MENDQPTTAGENPTINDEGKGSSVESTRPQISTLDAGRAALEQVIGGNGKKRGRPAIHGKYAGQRKKKKPAAGVSMGNLDNGSDSLLLDEDEPLDLLEDFEPVPEVNYREIAEVYVDPILDLVSEISSEVQRFRIFRSTKNAELAEMVAKETLIPEGPRKIMRAGIIGCAEKHDIDLSKSPETALLGGFLLWQMRAMRSAKEVVGEYFQQRPNELRPQAA